MFFAYIVDLDGGNRTIESLARSDIPETRVKKFVPSLSGAIVTRNANSHIRLSERLLTEDPNECALVLDNGVRARVEDLDVRIRLLIKRFRFIQWEIIRLSGPASSGKMRLLRSPWQLCTNWASGAYLISKKGQERLSALATTSLPIGLSINWRMSHVFSGAELFEKVGADEKPTGVAMGLLSEPFFQNPWDRQASLKLYHVLGIFLASLVFGLIFIQRRKARGNPQV